MKKLLIIEPWICHFEIFPSVIKCSNDIYSQYIIFSPDIKSANQSTNFLRKSSDITITKNINQLLIPKQSCDVWLNTTHQHGASESFLTTYNVLEHINSSNDVGLIFVVIHNQHDYKWIKQSLTSSPFSSKIIAVYLSNDSRNAYPLDINFIIFKPFILDSPALNNNYIKSMSDSLSLSIVGMCRDGKRFTELYRFRELIKKGTINFSYAGWSPKITRRSSGINAAIMNGYLSKCLMSEERISDKNVHESLNDSHAIIDLKIIGDKTPLGITSGNVGLSRALMIPLIAHDRHYPDFHCIRYSNYEHLLNILMDKSMITDILIRHRNKLINEHVEYNLLAKQSLMRYQ